MIPHRKIRFLIILSLILLALCLRLLPIFHNAISFHYDMGRDAFLAQEIWRDHNLKIQGPPTSTPGLYHGVLYYYLLALGYGLGNGDPVFASIEMIIINCLTIIPIFLITLSIFKKYIWSVLGGALYAVSFEANQFAPWLSNPAPAVFTVSMFFYGLYEWYIGRKRGLYIAIFFAGISTQLQFFLIYLFFIIGVFKIVFNLKISRTQLLVCVLIILITLGTFLASFYKFGTFFQALNGFLNITSGSDLDFRLRFSAAFLNYLDKFADLYINNFLPVNVFLGGLLGIAALLNSYKNKFIFFCMLSNIPIYALGGHNSNYSNLGMFVPAILSMILLLQTIIKKNRIFFWVLILIIFINNIFMIFKFAPLGQTLLVIQDDMILKNQISLIENSYNISNREPFAINALNLPMWTNTTWAYLYQNYGQKKYHYFPCFYGRDQIGLLGEDVFNRCSKPYPKSFFIIEPPEGISGELITNEINSENSKTKMIYEINYKSLRLQQRTPIEKN